MGTSPKVKKMKGENVKEELKSGQTIVLNSDAAASYVDSNGQDMIVVIQSDDFDQSQGLIVVDPSQLQQITGGAQIQGTAVTSSGLTIATPSAAVAAATTSDGQEMIVSDQTNESNSQFKSGEFIAVAAEGENLEAEAEGGQQVQFVMAAEGEGGEYILLEQNQGWTSFIQDSLDLL